MPIVAKRVIQMKVDPRFNSQYFLSLLFGFGDHPDMEQCANSNMSKPRQGVRLSQVQVQVQADRATRCIICVGKQAAFCHFAVFKFKVYLPLDLLNVSL